MPWPRIVDGRMRILHASLQSLVVRKVRESILRVSSVYILIC